ncbi:MAG TPA: aminodeoxychorismate synthase, component I [Nitrospira sp.]|nr:aminodeoxychorismate synthase, component I [Nitrospira sp.]
MTRCSQPSFLRGAPQPLVLSIATEGEHPLDLYEKIASASQPSFLLENGKGQSTGRGYSFFGSGPAAVVTLPTPSMASQPTDPFEGLRLAIGSPGIELTPDLPPFFGGAVGYFSYDFARRLETLPVLAMDDLQIPDMQFALYDLVTAVDHRTNGVQIIFCPPMERFLGEARDKLYREGQDRLAEWEARLKAPSPEREPLKMELLSFEPEQSRNAYLDRVSRAQAYIAAGDIYQANLSHRFSADLSPRQRSPLERLRYEHALYRQLRTINPAPFSGLLRFADLSFISSSPERLVQLRGRHAETRPIAGTRPRGSDAKDDQRLIGELLASPKERAEHVMLVDLERNDLGRVCEFGSVRVDEFMAIERYSHVSHIVSNISGILRSGATPFDLIRASFPGGTITGVPKIRCMEIIEELEPVRRGPYTGSFGYIGWNGDLDLNIVIRTLVVTGRKAYLQVGAGIVADSDPAKEYEETLHKAQAFFSSFQRA